MYAVARVGDPMTKDGRKIDIKDIVPLVRRTYVEGSLIAVQGDWEKAPGHDWEKLTVPAALRCTCNGLPVARVGTGSTADEKVASGATRTFVG